MSPFKSIKGRALGKLLEGYKSSDIGKGFGAGGAGAVGARATGGLVYTYDNNIIHLFISSGSFTTNSDWGSRSIEWIIVAGGGAGQTSNGGGTAGGGGGAGGYREGDTTIAGSAVSFNINVGQGGTNGVNNLPTGNGEDSYIAFPPGTERSNGGGHGAKYAGWAARAGGSGGGGAYGTTSGAAGNTPPYTPPQGNTGGDGISGGSQQGGGGGGAGGNGFPYATGNHGGIGRQIPVNFRYPGIVSMFSTGPGSGADAQFWVAGGGGGGNGPASDGKGGGPGGPYAGGGNKGHGTAASNGTANSGGGGGGVGQSDGSAGGNGGSGMVIMMYDGR